MYAPLTRNGYITRDKMAHLYETRPAQLESLDGLLELEASLPQRLLEPTNVKKPGKGKSLDYNERKAKKMMECLERTDQGLKAAKQARPSEKEQKDALLAAYRDTKPIERPPTPQVMPPEHQEQIEVACILLQRLLRGRAIQNIMYEGKERRLELIHELRLEAEEKAMGDEEAEAEAEAGLSTVVDAVQAEQWATARPHVEGVPAIPRGAAHHADCEEAERVRRIREAEEGGRRQKEIAR